MTEQRQDVMRIVEANRRWLRDQVWWRRWRQAAIDRFWLLVAHHKVRRDV